MFEISELKAKTLADLQQIAKSIGLTKTSQLKKLDLVYQILDIQATTPIKTEKKSENSTPKANKPKRKRVVKKVISEESISKDVTKPTSEVSEKKSNLDLNDSGDKQYKKPVHKTDGVEKNATIDKNASNEDKLVQNKPKPNHKKQKPHHNNNRNQKNQNQRNSNNGNKYKDPDFEFDGIIESE